MIHISISTKLSIVFTLFFVSLCAVAQSDRHNAIEKQTEAFVRSTLLSDANENTEIIVRAIDPRIQIPVCPEGYQFESPSYDSRSNNVSVKITCPSNQWFLFSHVSIQSMQQVVVSTQALSPGSLLSSRNIALADIEKSKIRGSSFLTVEEVQGARIKRRVREGSILNASMLCFVCKGDRVTISAISGGLSIQVYGIAEQDGTLGETIQVRNMSSDKLVIATVASTDEVQIKI
jgi:flagella basal body P-ring formation protein FlgA